MNKKNGILIGLCGIGIIAFFYYAFLVLRPQLIRPPEQRTEFGAQIEAACVQTAEDLLSASELLAGKTAAQRAEAQAKRSAKVLGCKIKNEGVLPQFLSEDGKTKISLLDITKGTNGYVKVHVKAWDNKGFPRGFGDGSVEIETINVQSPPLFAWDGTMVDAEWIDKVTGDKYQYLKRKYIDDPVLAMQQRLAKIVSAVSKSGNKIIAGKIGQTTTSCVPDANPETSTVDGFASHLLGAGSGISWSPLVAAAGTNSRDDTNGEDTVIAVRSDSSSNNWREIDRGIFLVDCSAIPDTDEISAVNFIINSVQRADNLSITPDMNVYSSAPASNTSLAAGDYDSLGTTAYATTISWASWTAAGDNTFVFNATGVAAISKTTITKLGIRNASYDVADSAPTWSTTALTFVNINFAAGTANDPEIVVTHAAAAGASNRKLMLIQ